MKLFRWSVIYLLHRLVHSNPGTKRTSTTHRYIEYCSADVHCAPLTSSGHSLSLHVSDCSVVMNPVAFENLRSELQSDPVSALATQCTRTATASV